MLAQWCVDEHKRTGLAGKPHGSDLICLQPGVLNPQCDIGSILYTLNYNQQIHSKVTILCVKESRNSFFAQDMRDANLVASAERCSGLH